MRILMVVPWFTYLGGNTPESQWGVFEYRQTMKLVERGNEFKVVSIRWRGQPNYEVIGEKIEVFRIAPLFIFPRIRYPIPNFIILTREIKKAYKYWNPDLIIYSHMIYLTALPIFWLKNRMSIPSVVTTDVLPGVSWFYGSKVVDGIGYVYTMLFGKRIFKLADGVQLLSSGLSEYVGKLNLASNRTFTIPRGVDTESFGLENEPKGLRNELGIAEQDVVVLYVGRLDLVKGVNYLLQAAERILASHNGIKFLIVGDGSLRQEYERFAKPFLLDIIFTGWRNDVPQLMNIADIFVLPSLSEGVANVAMEASASGLPVIATKVGEVPQIVSDGETGMLVEPKDVEGLVTATEKLIDNPSLAKKMGEAGRKRMEEKYNWDIICDRLEKAYQDVIERLKTSRDLPEVKD